jgi:PAS domain S-box-containing protein
MRATSNDDPPVVTSLHHADVDPFRLLVEAIRDYGILMLDPAGNVASWNPGAEQIKGYKAKDIIGQHFSCFYTREAVEQGWPQHELDVATRDGRFEDEGWRVRKDGSRFWANVIISALRDGSGTLLGFSKVTRDLTERKRAEEAIRAANAELERTVEELRRSNLDLQQFGYVASHDLQEPLRAVSGCVQVLKKRYQGRLDSRADELIGHTIDGVGRMQSLIDDLLSYSRVGTGGNAFEPSDCNEVLNKALANLEVTIEETGVVVTREQLPVVIADAAQLTQLFQNLISNAIKFRSQQPPTIHVAVRRDKGLWIFSVKDNGIGMQRQYFQRIFVIFQRLHTRTEYPGTGIGLAICKKIVERHGGRIWVESEPGQGTTFSFSIPHTGMNP